MPHQLQGEHAAALAAREIAPPLVRHIYTADPSAHVFDGRIYIYPSHDIEAGIAFNDNGDHFAMEDYHVLSLERPGAAATDHGVALHVRDVPWAARQMWAPDAAHKDGKYYLYFPAKRADGLFQIGVALGDAPGGPFRAEPQPIEGSYSIDPCVLEHDGAHYMAFGGIWGGQLQHYRNNTYHAAHAEPQAHETALGPRLARLSEDMKQFAEAPRELLILDPEGNPLLAGDHERRYFEGPWLHWHGGKYFLSYSTGDTHNICYATADDIYGPYTYQGRILSPVIGWTTHHSICAFEGRWYLFYHDSSLSRGVTHLRCVKMAQLHHAADGKIAPIDPYPG